MWPPPPLENGDKLFTSGAPQLPQALLPLVRRAGGRGALTGAGAGSPAAGSFGADGVDASGGWGARSRAGAAVQPWATGGSGCSGRSQELRTNGGDLSFLRRSGGQVGRAAGGRFGGSCGRDLSSELGRTAPSLWMAVPCSQRAVAATDSRHEGLDQHPGPVHWLGVLGESPALHAFALSSAERG